MRVLFFLLAVVTALRSLSATSLVTCMTNSQIDPSFFNVTFNPENSNLYYSLDLQTNLNTYIVADIEVYAYGFLIISEKLDLCDLDWKQFCPIFPGNLQVEGIEGISSKYVNMIPGIAYNVPNIDAVVKVMIRDRDSGQSLSCIQTEFTNGKTVSQTGARWATAVIAGLGLLIAAIMSTFGNSNAASHIAANSVSLFLYFQSVVVVSMQAVDRVPPIASAWSENLAWSMGLIRVEFMQKIFRWYVQSTGGTPSLFFIGTTKQILVQRALDHFKTVSSFFKRAENFALQTTDKLIVLRGIKRIGYNSGIEPTSIVVTGFTFFVLVGYVLIAVLLLVKLILTLLSRSGKFNNNRTYYFRTSFPTVLKGAILRYCYIGFTQLVILSLWEFTVQDSPAVIVLAVLFLLCSLTSIAYSYFKTVQYGRASIKKFNNPAALLYGDNKILNKFGYCYTMFHAEKYWFGIVLVGYNLVRAIFIGLCQASGKASSLVLFFVDLFYTIFLIYSKPYLNKSTNVLSYLTAVVTTLNSFLFVFFSNVFNQPAPVSSIMGWVFFILNAAFSLILLLMVLVFIGFSIFSKNPDARFAPARDDRFSFQNNKSGFNGLDEKSRSVDSSFSQNDDPNNELSALGVAAQEHSTNWESEMYKLNNLSGSTPGEEIYTPTIKQDEKFTENKPKESFGSKLKDKFSRSLSTKSKDPHSKKDKNVRISDTLSMDDEPNFTRVNDKPADNLHLRNVSKNSSNSFTNPRGVI